MPVNLPDARTAERLLDVVARLEEALKTMRHTSHAASGEVESRMANLQFENKRLKDTRAQAAARLASLMERLQGQTEQIFENKGLENEGLEDEGRAAA